MEIFSFSIFVDVVDVIFGNLELRMILEDHLVVFVVEPENMNLTSFIVLHNEHIHGCLLSLSVSVFLSLNSFFVAHCIFFTFLSSFQLLLIVSYDLHLLG